MRTGYHSGKQKRVTTTPVRDTIAQKKKDHQKRLSKVKWRGDKENAKDEYDEN